MSERLEQIRQRAEKATEGPWLSVPIVDSIEYFIAGENGAEAVAETVFTEEDALFIKESRDDIPYLLSEVDRMESAISTAHTKLQAVVDCVHLAQQTGGKVSAETIMPSLDGVLAELGGDVYGETKSN